MAFEPRIVKSSFAGIEAHGEQAAAYFYGRLFAENPRLRAMFPPAMDMQRDRLFRALTKIVWSLDSPAELTGYLSQLGRDHRKFGVRPEHYAAVGSALLATLRKFAGPHWTAEVEAAWTTAFTTAAGMMIDAAKEAASDAPPWWVAEVLGHELRAPDIAVLTVRPDQRLDFTAGQYVTVQTSRWPRVWRSYSIANAPRADGTLRFHVRAVPAGWVSGALVRSTKVGDTVLLGPALGGMTLDPESERDLLLVAGGTGLAPLKALAEQVITSGRQRDIQLVFGARTERELYDLPDLKLLESTYPWLRVHPVVADESGFQGRDGTVGELLENVDDLADREAYVAGPPDMITAAESVLHELGLPPERVHHDALDADSDLGGMVVHDAPPVPIGFIQP